MNFERMPTQTKNWFKDILHTVAFFGAFFLFAVVGSLVSVLCVPPAMLLRGVRARFFGQKLIHWLFRIFVGYMRMFGLVELEASELSGLRDGGRIDCGGESSLPARCGADGFPDAAGGLPDEGESGTQYYFLGNGAAGRVYPQ